MTLTKFDLEGASPSGTALSPGNTGFTRVTVNTNTAVSSSAWVHGGLLSGLLSAPNAAQVFLGYDFTANATVALRAYVRFGGMPSTATALLRLATTDAGTLLGAVNVSLNGSWSLTNPAGSVVFGSPAAVLTTNTDYRVEMYWKVGAGTGEAHAAWYAGDSLTPLTNGDSTLLTAQANGSANVGSLRAGKASTSGTWSSIAVDDVAVLDGATGLIGPELLGYPGPTGLTVTPVGTDELDLAWNAVTGVSAYDVERDGLVIARDVAALAYNDTGLAPATLYNYKVGAVHP